MATKRKAEPNRAAKGEAMEATATKRTAATRMPAGKVKVARRLINSTHSFEYTRPGAPREASTPGSLEHISK